MARKRDGVFENLTRSPWPVGLVSAFPKMARCCPNPYVVLTVGLLYPGNMASCQEVSCATSMYSKGEKQNIRDSGLVGLSDEEISRRLNDPSTSSKLKKKLQKEQKANGTRNQRKRRK